MRNHSLPGLVFLGFALAVGCGSATSDNGSPSAMAGAAVSGGSGAAGSVLGAGAAGAPGSVAGSGGMPLSNSSGGVPAGGMAAANGGLAASAGSSGAPPGGAAALFSDDFEAATISSKWTPRINGGTKFDLDTNQKHGGNQSLHLKHSGFSTFLAAEGAPLFPAPGNTFYARLWLRVAPEANGALTQGHVVWFEAGDVTNDTHEIRVGANIGKFQSNLWPSDADLRDPDAKFTTNAWHCVQVQYGNDLLVVTLDGTKSSISTTDWVATESVNGNTAAKSNWSPAYAAFRIGWELGSGEVWYDDVALGHGEIGCE